MSSLIAQFRGVVCDLDGVVYAGPKVIDHAVESLNAAIADGVDVIFATNNASREPSAVSEHLMELGVSTDAQHVINSSIAGAHVLRDSIPAGSSVLAVGGSGVATALRDEGFEAITAEGVGGRQVAAVMQGYGPDVKASDLAAAAYAIQGGATWVATNTDKTLPTDRGQAPGNGSLVAAVRYAVDDDPKVAGKPMPVMYDLAAERMGLPREQIVGIGDRLETDIEGANRGGYESVLVLTGVHGLRDAAAAPKLLRPTYVIGDLRELGEEYLVAQDVSIVDGEVRSESTGLPVLRAALTQLWAMVDAGELTHDAAGVIMRGAEQNYR